MKTGSAPLTLAVLAVSNMPCAYLTVSVSFCQFAFYPLSWLPSRNSKRPLMKTGSDASLYPLSSHPSARESFRTQTHDTLCTNEKNRSSLINSTDQYELLQPLNPRRAASASEPLKNPSLSEPTCKKTTIHNDYSTLSLIVDYTLFMRPIFLFILVRCHL